MILTVYGATLADRDILYRYLGHDKVEMMRLCGMLQLTLPNRREAVQNTERLLEMLDLTWD